MKYSEKELPLVAKKIVELAKSKVICFHGVMGAGKTTLIKALVKELGGAGNTNSPTFGIVNEYYTTTNELLGYHFDFYRLNHEHEALDFGVEEYLYSGAWVFIEWSDKIFSYIPEDCSNIYIEIIDTKIRNLTID
ncbi:tRNA (adenosine(37)-N6)-threonylcarbamoyltransferase complex ATPase subunit type 1 TsaE [Sediminicola arcticus]|jgi:tRNA threonylcarbamoyladenosine biosynthesis protein TsaE|uniref:tRNA threonylcarbamoyladenosine biosynthesis protein TsaE n=1 Tax=Sediminicola arcticus TaxID=1574308 RepID=A0ABV2SW90_9FLAO